MADLEVLCSKAQPFQIAMNPDLLNVVTSRDKRSLDELLQQHYPSGALGEEIAITIPEDAERQNVTSYLLGVTPEGNTALHIVASRGHLELAEEICRRERSLLEIPNMRLDTPLHHAARVGHDNIVSLIIQFVRERWIEARRVLRATNMDDANALHEAAKYNHASTATALIEEDVELASMLNDAGMSPLYLAIMTGSIDVAKALLQSSSWERASPKSYAGPDKKTVLHAAALLHPEIIEDILKREPRLTKCVDSSGRTPLHYAASDGDDDTVKLLLKHDPSTAYLSDVNGLFPIHVAAGMGNASIVDQILQQCPEIDELSDRKGKNLQQWPEIDELSDRKGKNFLHFAFKNRKLDVVKQIISKIPYLKKLLNDRDNKGKNLQQWPKIDELSDRKGKNFLHFAFKKRELDVVKQIISKRPYLKGLLNYRDKKGNTPLHTAVKNGDEQSVDFLLRDKTVNINVINNNGFTPLDFAYAKLDKDLRFAVNADDYIAACLALTKAQFGPRQLHASKRIKSSGDSSYRTKEKKNDLKISQNFVITSVLVATVTFAAGFTVPGGYIADDHPGRGTAVLAKEYAFRAFLVTDACAFVFSTFATFWFTFEEALIFDKHVRRQGLFLAMHALLVAIAAMSTAFGMAMYASLAPSRKRISFLLLCISIVSTAYLAHVASSIGVVVRVARTVMPREGMMQLFRPTVHPVVRKRLFFLVYASGLGIGICLLPPILVVAGFLVLAML